MPAPAKVLSRPCESRDHGVFANLDPFFHSTSSLSFQPPKDPSRAFRHAHDASLAIRAKDRSARPANPPPSSTPPPLTTTYRVSYPVIATSTPVAADGHAAGRGLRGILPPGRKGHGVRVGAGAGARRPVAMVCGVECEDEAALVDATTGPTIAWGGHNNVSGKEREWFARRVAFGAPAPTAVVGLQVEEDAGDACARARDAMRRKRVGLVGWRAELGAGWKNYVDVLTGSLLSGFCYLRLLKFK
ncbi:hypothetical protein HK101_000625 [Irineochytrium annulatum]|nr:hypothetical protein HK101_000625 [Irineochytrium annulatum]